MKQKLMLLAIMSLLTVSAALAYNPAANWPTKYFEYGVFQGTAATPGVCVAGSVVLPTTPLTPPTNPYINCWANYRDGRTHQIYHTIGEANTYAAQTNMIYTWTGTRACVVTLPIPAHTCYYK